jgi:hypothetical protein
MNHYMKTAVRMFLSLCFCLSLYGAAHAQEITGSIVGTVTDATGAVVHGATVTITDLDKKIVVRTLNTGDDGTFSAPQIPPGNYDIGVEAAGFKKHVEAAVKLDLNQRRTVDVKLEAGKIEEVVTVTSEPLQVELQTPAAANLISGTQVRELPLNSRNFVQLTTLMPGVSSNLDDQAYVGTTNPAGQANVVAISVNGARSSSNTWMVDGADTTDRGSNLTIQTYPSVDAIGEFKVLRGLYGAESGRSGGGQVSVITRSGTNEFHGTLYEFVRNERLNANDFFSNKTSPVGRDAEGRAKRPPFRYNNFGGTIGGPVYLPRFGEGGPAWFSGKNRTFFFFSEEQRRDIRFPTLSATIPTLALRQGIFPVAVCTQLNAAGTACVESSRTTQITNISPVARAYINAFYANLPQPNSSFTLTSAARNVANFRQEILKIDHNFSTNLTAFYRFENDKIPTEDVQALFSSGTPIPGVSTTTTDSPGKTHVLRATYSINPSLVLDGGYIHSYGAILSEVVGKVSLNNSPELKLALPFTNTRDRVPTLAGIGFTGISGFGPYDNFSTNDAWQSNLSWVAGAHTMKFGAYYTRFRKFENALAGFNEGQFSGFPNTGRPTSGTNPATGQPFTTGQLQTLQQYAYFLLGTNATFTQAKFDFTADLRAQNFESYAQDEWRVKPNLTLYYGVRYSFFGQPYDNNNKLSNFDPRLYNPANAPQVNSAGNRIAGTGNALNGIIVNTQDLSLGGTPSPYGKALADSPKLNFAPRVGLVWDPFRDGKTSIRTGYGIYHDQLLVGVWEQNIGANPPYQENVTITGTTLDNPTGGTVAVSAAAPSLRGVEPNWKTPYYQQWSLDVQHQLFSKTLIDIGYYGSKGTHLPGIVDINLLPAGFAATQQCRNAANALVPCQATTAQGVPVPFTSATQELLLDQIRPFRGYRAISIIEPRFNSNYHSMQLYLQQRFTDASQVSFAYTFSKNLTDNQTDRSTAPQNPFDIRSDYGRSQLDRRHVVSANWVYQLPWYADQKGLAGHLLGGWELSGIGIYYSGLPFTVTTSNLDPAGNGFLGPSSSGPRPNVVCDPNSSAAGTVDAFFNTTCFASPTGQFTPGNAPRGVVDGPTTKRVDLSLMKNIRFGESTRLQLRAEAFNIFNHTNFRTLSLNNTATNFGQVLTTRDPRTVQLGAKFFF